MDGKTVVRRWNTAKYPEGVGGAGWSALTPLRHVIGAGLIFATLGSPLVGCAFMFPGLDRDNPFDGATLTATGDRAEIVRSDLLKRLTLGSTPIEEAHQVLRNLGAECVREPAGGGYRCVYKNVWTGTYFILAVVHRVWYFTYRVHLAEAAGELDDLSVKVEEKTVDY